MILHKNIYIDDASNLFKTLSTIRNDLCLAMEDVNGTTIFILDTPENHKTLYTALYNFNIDLAKVDLRKPFEIMGLKVQLIYDLKMLKEMSTLK